MLSRNGKIKISLRQRTINQQYTIQSDFRSMQLEWSILSFDWKFCNWHWKLLLHQWRGTNSVSRNQSSLLGLDEQGKHAKPLQSTRSRIQFANERPQLPHHHHFRSEVVVGLLQPFGELPFPGNLFGRNPSRIDGPKNWPLSRLQLRIRTIKLSKQVRTYHVLPVEKQHHPCFATLSTLCTFYQRIGHFINLYSKFHRLGQA